MNPLEERIQELKELSKAEHPHLEDWYIQVCVEAYIRENEPELLQYKDIEEDPETKPSLVIEEIPDETDQS